ncbi:hypothetical protein RB614_42300 [Phytohabitans sp. ZYX-F-186]|uniref:ABC3 transporter permease protein domain-containing protein n=1 Tax=Phytohabitans maris TaxID=3071409 RepID=A0ABU0ZVY4_9ACTN|nr:hypothetical protein [Phytohabitans sp. ZYX-F-186]MDQ7911142.1 hypothetical protein [Phytohabitans sp. ZYX-F-186]
MTVATTAFTILGGANTRRVEIVGATAPSAPTTYDILVLPPGAASGTGRVGGDSLLRPRQWQDVYGGITLEQARRIQRIPGVEVAAPIAMVGYILQTVHVAIPIPGTRPRAPAAYSATITHTTDQGLSRIVQPHAAYTYVTADKDCPPRVVHQDAEPGGDPFAVQTRRVGTCWSSRVGSARAAQPSVEDTWTFPTLVAAVDPTAEAALNGLDKAVSAGQYLPEYGSSGGDATIPAIRADTLAYNDHDTVAVARLPDRVAAAMAAGASAAQVDRLLSGARETVVATRTVTSADAYRQLVSDALSPGRTDVVDAFWTTTPVDYVGHADGQVSVTPQPSPPPATWQVPGSARKVPPVDASDSAARQLVRHATSADPGGAGSPLPRLSTVGTFDPARVSVGRRGVGAFAVPPLAAADAATRQALGGRDLLPNANPAGYPSVAPTMLIPLDRVGAFTDTSAFRNVNQAGPVSAVRVRVAGVTGTDALSRERVRAIADEISGLTGLRVSVTLGATPARVAVTVPAGHNGRPQLTVAETWFRESAAAVSVRTRESQSQALLVVLLLVCGLAVANATLASTRALAPELRQQARLGLLPGEIFRHLLAEAGLLALAAGLVSALLVWPVTTAARGPVSSLPPLLAVPVALAVGLAAAVVPAWRASVAAHSGRPERPPRVRRLHARGPLRASIVQLLRTPSRSAICLAAVAVGSGALTLDLLRTFVWRGAVVSELFGVPVSLQDRWVDTAATALIVLTAALVVGDAGWLAVRERRAELADLRVQGLLGIQVAGLVARELAILVVLGAALGGAVGLTVAAALGAGIPS